MTTVYDIVICGSGPIGTMTAYHLRDHPNLKVALITRDPLDDPDHLATYKWAGGSVRLYWDDPWKMEGARRTFGLAQALMEEGVALDALRNTHVFVNHGRTIPGVNLAGAKMIREVQRRAVAAGVALYDGVTITDVRSDGELVTVVTDAGALVARQALLALGWGNAKLLPSYQLPFEKRNIFILDTPVDELRSAMPHLIVPVGDGVVFTFVKNVGGVLRVVVGQEGIIDHHDAPGPEDYWSELLDRGAARALPYLADARPIDILWGFDAHVKTLTVTEALPNVLVANCGSAVRVSALIGAELADRLRVRFEAATGSAAR